MPSHSQSDTNPASLTMDLSIRDEIIITTENTNTDSSNNNDNNNDYNDDNNKIRVDLGEMEHQSQSSNILPPYTMMSPPTFVWSEMMRILFSQ